MALTPLFLTGYEHGFSGTVANMILGGGLAATGSGAVTVTTGSARNGTYGLHAPAPANTACYARHTYTASAKVVVRVALRVTALPPATNNVVIFLIDGSQSCPLEVSNTGACRLHISGGSNFSGPNIGDGQWHLFEFQLDFSSTTTWTIDWKVDGIAQTRVTAAETSAGTVSAVECGTHGTTTTAFTCDYDDLIVGTWTTAATDWWGDGLVLGQLAGSDGTHATPADFSPGDAGTVYSGTPTTAYTMVDDAPATSAWTTTRDTADNLAMRVVNTAAYMEIAPVSTVRGGQANAVRAIMSYSSPTATANAAGCVARNSAGAVTALLGTVGGTLASYAVTANNFKSGLVTTPAAGWTAAEVNAVRFRFGGGTSSVITNVPTVQALMLEVDWPTTVLLPAFHHRHLPPVMAEHTRGRF